MGFILWLIYSGLLGVSLVSYVKEEWRTYTVLGIMDFLISCVTWLGLFSFITDQQIIPPNMWALFVLPALLWDIGSTVLFPQKLTSRTLEPIPLVGRLFSLLLLAPLYYALFSIAFS